MSLPLALFLGVLVLDGDSKTVSKRSATQYDEAEARMLLNLAAGAYATGDNLTACVNSVQPTNQQHQVLVVTKENCDQLNNPCESYIVANDQQQVLYLVFRGTKTSSQLLIEGWSTLQPGVDFFGMGQVNSYFFNGHQLLWDEMVQVLQSPQYSNYAVTITGHSLGGALASLAAARIALQGWKKNSIKTNGQIKLVTFGQPRTGDAQYAQAFDSLISYSYRVTHKMDIVPHLPACAKTTGGDTRLDARDSLPCEPTVMTKAYHHGTEIWYPDSMDPGASFRECTGLPKNEDFSCSDQFKFRIGASNDYIWDHRHYFTVRVPEFGIAGCDPSLPEGVQVLKFEKGK